ncbi:E3 ubiquitin/ISG15 ligase TRIM25-like [Pelobates fuscus]|uniref:E3 ubiquitin/ISG15 ligase TRIM25-like n=1 Tax=Pelobates fuscus TaxID=191477 RepID=UPI002FE47F4B
MSFLLSMMASADLRYELTCSICLNIYTDPVTLTCGHSFCRICIGDMLGAQDRSKYYTCPECQVKFPKRPSLERNKALCKMVENFLCVHPEKEKVKVFCTYCLHTQIPAAKTCLLCEASLCDTHLKVHIKSAEHVLIEPTISLENIKCSIHRKVLEYYCCEDAACICVSCSLAGEHRGHQVETLIEASEKKKDELRDILEKLTSKREEAEKRFQNLQELRREVQEKAAGVTKRVTAMIRGIREELDVLEKRVHTAISREEEQVSLRVSDIIQQLEMKKEELSRKIGHIEELCKMTDPLTVLQGWKSHSSDYCDTEEGDNADREREDIKVCASRHLNTDEISVTLHKGLAGLVTGIKRLLNVRADELLVMNIASGTLLDVHNASHMLLDVETASNNVAILDDFKTASWSEISQCRSETPKRFQFYQVLSSGSFSSGRHYWEVEGSKSGGWRVGMAYPSIDRKGDKSGLGNNNQSWCLEWLDNKYSLRHNSKITSLPHRSESQRLMIYLDYNSGRLSFYELSDCIKHLHTFTATFTEPLHVGCRVFMNSWVSIVRKKMV